MAGPLFNVSCYNDFLTYVKAFTLQYVVRRPYGRHIKVNVALRWRLMPPEIGIINFFHLLFCMVPVDQYKHMLSNIKSIVLPALVEENRLLECVTLPTFSSPYVRERCRPRLLLMYISCLGNVWEVLCMQDDAVGLSELLISGSFNWCQRKTKSDRVDNVSTLHDTMFMGAVVRCMLNNEGYATLLLFALTEHYEHLFRARAKPFTVIGKNTVLSKSEIASLRPLTIIAYEAMVTVFGSWKGGKGVHAKAYDDDHDILFNNHQCYAFALSLYNLKCDIDGKNGTYLWDANLFSNNAENAAVGNAERFMNEVNMWRANVVEIFLCLERPAPLSAARPSATSAVNLSIKKRGFGKLVSVEVPLPRDGIARVNAFTKNKVVTLYMLCPRLRSISCLNEAYTRNNTVVATKKGSGTQRFVRHSNKIATGLGPCTFSLYKSQDSMGMGSCINTFNFHTSGNYLELCISLAAVELDMMKPNPTRMYPVTLAVRAQHNTCTTVDLPGILNPETALSRSKMVLDSDSTPMVGPTKTTRFPAYNVFVSRSVCSSTDREGIHEFKRHNNLPPPAPTVVSRTKRSRKRSRPVRDDEEDELNDNCGARASKRRRACAAFDDSGIVCDHQKYTVSQMKRMTKSYVSWELHRNNINTSYFHGETLANKLRLMLSWYLGRDGVEFDPRKQNFIASLERNACALLPFNVLFLAEMQYILKNTATAAQLDMQAIFVSRSMICTYGAFSRGNAYMPHTSKNMLSWISAHFKVHGIHDSYGMNKSVLCELVERKEMDMGHIRTLVEKFIKENKNHMPLCLPRSRADGVGSSLMYGPEHFVQTFLETVPLLKALKLNLKEGARDSKHVISVLDQNYGMKT